MDDLAGAQSADQPTDRPQQIEEPSGTNPPDLKVVHWRGAVLSARRGGRAEPAAL